MALANCTDNCLSIPTHRHCCEAGDKAVPATDISPHLIMGIPTLREGLHIVGESVEREQESGPGVSGAVRGRVIRREQRWADKEGRDLRRPLQRSLRVRQDEVRFSVSFSL